MDFYVNNNNRVARDCIRYFSAADETHTITQGHHQDTESHHIEHDDTAHNSYHTTVRVRSKEYILRSINRQTL